MIIGEAVDKIPRSVQVDNPQIPWRVMNDIRNKHIHEYHTVKPDKLWKMAKLSLPKIKPLPRRDSKTSNVIFLDYPSYLLIGKESSV